MDIILKLAEFFLLSVSFSLLLFSHLASYKLTGVGFTKLTHSISAVSLLLAASLHFFFYRVIDYYVIATFAVLLMAAFIHTRDDQSKFLPIRPLLIVEALLVLGVVYRFNQLGHYQLWYLLSSLLFLGIITYAMVLGHWYLVVPKLTEKPLLVAVKMIWALCFIKACISIYAMQSSQAFVNDYNHYNPEYSFNWLMLLMRLGWGIVIVAILNYYTGRLVKMRSIQSATGLLYVMTFFIFIGEVLASYMYFKSGLAI